MGVVFIVGTYNANRSSSETCTEGTIRRGERRKTRRERYPCSVDWWHSDTGKVRRRSEWYRSTTQKRKSGFKRLFSAYTFLVFAMKFACDSQCDSHSVRIVILFYYVGAVKCALVLVVTSVSTEVFHETSIFLENRFFEVLEKNLTVLVLVKRNVSRDNLVPTICREKIDGIPKHKTSL